MAVLAGLYFRQNLVQFIYHVHGESLLHVPMMLDI